jgi:hypothetical protein
MEQRLRGSAHYASNVNEDKRRTKELDFYMEKIYPRQLNSFPLFGIDARLLDRQGGLSLAGNKLSLGSGRRGVILQARKPVAARTRTF